jgi:hypothetical protein
MNSGAMRLIAFSTRARPGRISGRPRSMPAIARSASASADMPRVPLVSASNSARIRRVSTGGGASSNTCTRVPASCTRSARV